MALQHRGVAGVRPSAPATTRTAPLTRRCSGNRGRTHYQPILAVARPNSSSSDSSGGNSSSKANLISTSGSATTPASSWTEAVLRRFPQAVLAGAALAFAASYGGKAFAAQSATAASAAAVAATSISSATLVRPQPRQSGAVVASAILSNPSARELGGSALLRYKVLQVIDPRGVAFFCVFA